MIAVIKTPPEKISSSNLGIFGVLPIECKVQLEKQFDCLFAKGYEGTDYIDEALLNEAQRKAQVVDWAIIFVATQTDRLPNNQHQLIRSVQLVQENIIVLAKSNSLSHLPWESHAKAIIQFGKEDIWEEIIEQLFT